MLGQVELFLSLVACFKIILFVETSSNSTNNSRGLTNNSCIYYLISKTNVANCSKLITYSFCSSLNIKSSHWLKCSIKLTLITKKMDNTNLIFVSLQCIVFIQQTHTHTHIHFQVCGCSQPYKAFSYGLLIHVRNSNKDS